MANNHWLVCECNSFRQWRESKPCLYSEATALDRGDPPRCIRHGALLFSDTTLDGLSRLEAGKRLVKDWLERD